MAKPKLAVGTLPIPMNLPTVIYRVLCEFSIRAMPTEQIQSIVAFNVSTIVDYCVKQGWLELCEKEVIQVIGPESYMLCDGVKDLLEPLVIERSKPRVHYSHQGIRPDGLLKSGAQAQVYVFDHTNFTQITVYLPREDIRGGKVVWSASEINWPSCGAQPPNVVRLYQNAIKVAIEIAAEADKQFPVGENVAN